MQHSITTHCSASRISRCAINRASCVMSRPYGFAAKYVLNWK